MNMCWSRHAPVAVEWFNPKKTLSSSLLMKYSPPLSLSVSRPLLWRLWLSSVELTSRRNDLFYICQREAAREREKCKVDISILLFFLSSVISRISLIKLAYRTWTTTSALQCQHRNRFFLLSVDCDFLTIFYVCLWFEELTMPVKGKNERNTQVFAIV